MLYTVGDKTTTTTVSAKSNRQRIEYGGEMTILMQCDSGTAVQINETHKRFLVASASNTAATAPKKGGLLTYTSTVVDTGERKQMFGLAARRLTTTVTKEPGAGACDKRRERVDTDGWFVDRPAALACGTERKPATATTGDCTDDVKYAETGPAAGYPLEYTVTTSADGGKPSVMTMAVTALERQNLPDALFSTPDGYAEVKTLAELSADATAGVSKIGVMALTNKTRDKVSLDVLSNALVVSLGDTGLKTVLLEASSPAAALTEARAKSVDYVLITQVTDISKPSRGLMSKVGGSKEFGAKVDYVLTAPGSPTARLSSSERSGTSTVQSAVSTARTIARYTTPFGVLSSQLKFMNTFSDLTGGVPSSTMSQSPDPVINTIFSLVSGAPAKPSSPEESPQSEDAAVAMALEKEVAAVAAALATK